MMTIAASAPQDAATALPATVPELGRRTFSTRPGRVRRVLRLLRERGPCSALRGGVSLLYARLTASGRVRAMRDWSASITRPCPPSQAQAAPDQAGIEQLLARVAGGCAKSVQLDVLDMTARRYCRTAATDQLLALRVACGIDKQLQDNDSASARAARDVLVAVLDLELERRTVAAPLRGLAQAMRTKAPSEDVDRACARLAVSLQAAQDVQGMPELLLRNALANLAEPDLSAIRGLDENARRDVVAQHRSPELRERRQSLLRLLDRALSQVNGVVARDSGQAAAGALPSPAPDANEARAAVMADRMALCLDALRNAAGPCPRIDAVRQLETAARAYADWKQAIEATGREVPAHAAERLRTAVADILHTHLRSPDNPDGPLQRSSLAALSEPEIAALRRCANSFGDVGLSIDSKALKEEATSRSAPLMEIAAERAVSLLRLVEGAAASLPEVVGALRDCAHAVREVCAARDSFELSGAEDRAALCARIVDAAARQSQGGQAGAAHSHSFAAVMPCLVSGLLDAGMLLIDGLEDAGVPESDPEWMRVRHVYRLLELGSLLAGALQDVLQAANGDAQSAPRPPSAAGWSAGLRQAVAEQFGVRYDAAAGRADLVLTGDQHRRLAEFMLNTPMPPVKPVRRSLATADGPQEIELDRQLALDGIDRRSAGFSVCGVDPSGRYVPYTSSRPAPAAAGGDAASEVAGLYRALLALQRLAGPDTLALSAFATQSIGNMLYGAFAALRDESPVRLSDGRAVLLGGGAETHADVRRYADGSYSIGLNVTWEPLTSVAAWNGDDLEGVLLDGSRSRGAVFCEMRLTRDASGEWTRELLRPLELHYHLAPLARAETPISGGG
ncbi:hypothetical protein CAL14_19215 [Bordetella genomosp. 9]|uniref:hypothetical protein n=1 Tax=Bordetella genomosp. 9 TaxID=1416803 RepID=UPI000A28D458|nr:hypothetical protein [Bordetella genomosp. 9]ARP92148.1 hypothetical protein CAL14_19215 [Bordetella genomosp. 9]